MKTFKTIRDEDFGLNIPVPPSYIKRKAARAIVLDGEGKIGLMYSTKYDYYKLPGGGVEEGETIIEGLKRETMEEIGCNVENIKELGIIEEYRNEQARHQTSYCFIANVCGDKKEPQLEDDEIAEGFVPAWMKLEEAIKFFEENSDVENYSGKFMHLRDYLFLTEAKRVLT